MAIRIGGTSIIDDNKNISNVGVVTIGTGGTTGRVQVGTGTTIFGSGNVAIAGTLSALDISVPLKIDAFNPSNLATNVVVDSNIEIYFNKSVGVGTTGFIELKTNSGALLQRFNVGAATTQISLTNGSRTLVINPTNNFGKSSPGTANTIFTVITKEFINDPFFTGINTTTSVGVGTTYKFSIEAVGLGQTYEGGFLICASGGTQWIAAQLDTEVARNWYSRGDASTTAQSISGCSGWFIPTCAQLQNPGYQCRVYWDETASEYWSDTPISTDRANAVSMTTGTVSPYFSFYGMRKSFIKCVRAFRCVTY